MLKTYMFFSRCSGSWEGAALVFAHTAQEAKKIGWQYCWGLIVDEYTDCAVRLIRNSEYLYQEANQEKLKNDEAHANDQPRTCSYCTYWGVGPIGPDGLCDGCRCDLAVEQSLAVDASQAESQSDDGSGSRH